MLEERRKLGKLDSGWRMGATAEDVYRWWLRDSNLPGQMSLFEDE